MKKKKAKKQTKKSKAKKQSKKVAKRTAPRDFIANKFLNIDLDNGLSLRLEVFFVNDICVYSQEAINKLGKATQDSVYKQIDEQLKDFNVEVAVKEV